MTEEITEAERQSFTSWKLDVLDAMSCDEGVTDADFRSAFRLMQHVNARTLDANPSIDRLAAQVAKSRYSVMRSLERLSKTWINRVRENRTKAFNYSFRTDRLRDVIDGKNNREDIAKAEVQARRRSRFDVAKLPPRDVASVPPRDVANLPSVDVADLPPKHLSPNYLNRTPVDSSLSERGDLSCGTVFPTQETEFGPWVFENIPDKSHHREALRLLRAGQMTPEIYRRMAA